MSVTIPLHEKQKYEVQFNANDSSDPSDLYIVLTGWVPVGAASKLPANTDDAVKPGQFVRVQDTAPARTDALRLRVEVSVPNPTGGGTLIITQGSDHQTLTVTGDSFYLSPLIP